MRQELWPVDLEWKGRRKEFSCSTGRAQESVTIDQRGAL